MNRTRMAEKLEAEIAAVQTFVMLEHVDDDGHLWCPARGIERIKRIASIMRRLKRCNECLRGKIPELEERGRPWMEYQVIVWEDCPRCNGTGMAI